mmetsp:Transcript_57464/g.168744  ORF Transcript_57464/g.168744 Transcript_57464/m.168744 type:complete len:243 (+) Transcript_57464:1322-2050(+)
MRLSMVPCCAHFSRAWTARAPCASLSCFSMAEWSWLVSWVCSSSFETRSRSASAPAAWSALSLSRLALICLSSLTVGPSPSTCSRRLCCFSTFTRASSISWAASWQAFSRASTRTIMPSSTASRACSSMPSLSITIRTAVASLAAAFVSWTRSSDVWRSMPSSPSSRPCTAAWPSSVARRSAARWPRTASRWSSCTRRSSPKQRSSSPILPRASTSSSACFWSLWPCCSRRASSRWPTSATA